MLALVLLLGGFQQAVANGVTTDAKYVIRKIASCPDVGFFFKQEPSPNAVEPLCFLCFCQDDGTATCWKRQNRRCDAKSYNNFEKRDSRIRRSPISLGELFVRDAAREFFNKQSPEQCKPYESSFSDGCPPADWCIGCTVCDCDANGRWDCHILSFCPDKNGKKQMKKSRKPVRNRISKRQSKTSPAKPTTKSSKPPQKNARKTLNKSNHRRNQAKQMSGNNKHMIDPVKSTKVKKFTPIKKPKTKLQAKKASPSQKKVSGKPLLIKKDVSTNKPVNIKASKLKPNRNNTVDVAQKVVKQFMASMQKMMKNIEKKTTNNSKQVNKIVKKRSMAKQEGRQVTKIVDNKPKFVAKRTSKAKVNRTNVQTRAKPNARNTKNKKGRNKRQVTMNVNIPDMNYLNTSYTENLANAYVLEDNKTITNLVVNSTPAIYSPETKHTVDPLRLESNRDVYLTGNKIYEENNSIKEGVLYSNINSLTTSYGAFNNTQTVTPWLFDKFGFTDGNRNTSNNNVQDVTKLSTDRSDSTTNFISDGKANKTDILENRTGKSKNEKMFWKNTMYYTIPFKKEKYYHKKNVEHGCKFRTIFESLLGTYRNNTTHIQKKPKRYTILTKIKRLFKRIFHNSRKRKSYQTDLQCNNYETARSNDTKSGHCKVNTKEKIKLRERIYDLRNESETIIKSIRIIKGLLHILEMNNNESQPKSESEKSFESINKLNKIIKDSFGTERHHEKLTNDQRRQINYVKDNVKVFIRSIGKFATILDDVIQSVMYHNNKHDKMINIITRNNDNRRYMNEMMENNNTTRQKLKKLKKLILSYNGLQNKFVNQIYSVLDNLEANTNENVDASHHSKTNSTNAVEVNSANIIRNIRKLKVIAENLNDTKRKKRETIDDEDAMEYLLILMEYLLKRHAPENPPVNDGIDLLLEAIRSAPDIKPIKKKVLEYMTERTDGIKVASPIKPLKEVFNYSYSNSLQKVGSHSSQTEKNIPKTYLPYDDDDDDDDSVDEMYPKFKSAKDLSSGQKPDDVIHVTEQSTKTPDTFIIGSDFDNSSYYKADKIPKYKANNDEDSEEIITSTISVSLETTTDNAVIFHNNINTESSQLDTQNSTSNNNNILIDTKANTDWIEENFKGIKQLREIEINSPTSKSVINLQTSKERAKIAENLSDITNEVNTDAKDKGNKLDTEEVMSKKRMDLLNSLDYVVEKDSTDDDKYSSDSYFA